MPVVPAWEILPAAHVGAIVRRGLPLKEGAILVGEEGRGRRIVRVAPPHGSVVEGDRVVAIPVSRNSAVAVVLIRDFSGYRGTWDLVAPLPEDVISTFVETQNRDLLAREEVRPLHEIARGHCAQGIAGRMGGGAEILFVASAGETYDVVRWGRLYGAPRVLRLTVQDDGTVRITNPIAEYEAARAASRW